VSYFTLMAFSGRAAVPRPREGLGIDPDQVVNALREAFVREFGNPGRLPQRAILFEAIRHRPTRRSVVKGGSPDVGNWHRSDEVITIERVGSLVFSGPACNGANGRGWL